MKFEMPETLAGLDADALDELRRAAEAAFNDIYGDGKSLSDEDLSALETLAGNLEAIDAAHADVVADETRRDSAAALAEKIASRKADADADEDDDEDDEDDDSSDADADDSDEEDEDDEDDNDNDNADDLVDEKEPAMTAGGRRKTRFSGLPTDQSKIPARKIEGYSLSPHVPGYTPEPVDSLKIAEVFTAIKSGSSFGTRTPDSAGVSAIGIASIDRAFPEDLVATDEASLTAALDRATNESNLDGGSLVAAGGWCAPSETLYSFLGIPAASDLLSLPEVNINRGGVRFPVQPDFGALYSEEDLFFHYTEAEMVADDPEILKPCYEIPCVDFDEVRLDALGLCITGGILQQRAYPELIQVYVDGIMKNHQHRLSALSIQRIRAGSGSVNEIPADSVGSAYGALLNSVELAIVDIRLNQRIPDGTSLEVILPVWAKAVLRADIAYRRGADVLTISDEQIRAHFAARNANVQYVGDYQVGGVGQPGGATPLLRLPDTVEFIVYPAGTWFRSLQNVIEVGVMYDKAQLQRNRYTQLFTEDAFAVAKRGAVSRMYSVPLRADGSVGPALPFPAPVEVDVEEGGDGEGDGEDGEASKTRAGSLAATGGALPD